MESPGAAKPDTAFAAATARAAFALALTGVLALGPFGAPPAAAQQDGGKKKVLLVKTQRHADSSNIAATRVDNAVGTFLAIDSRLELFLPEGLAAAKPAAAPEPVEVDEQLVRAAKAVDEAAALRAKGRHMDATKAYRRAMSLYEKRLDKLENFDLYVDAQLQRALAFYDAGYDDNGEEELAKVLAMRPSLVLDRRQTPKAAMESLERLRAVFGRSAAEPVTVEANAEGALVYVNGVLAGPAPATLTTLVRGRHWVRVTADGHEPWAGSVDAGPRARTVNARLKPIKRAGPAVTAAVAATPDGLAAAARTGDFSRGFASGAAALCALHSLDGVVMTYLRARPEGYEIAGFYFEAASSRVAEVDPILVDLDLINLQAKAQELSERLVAATQAFPEARVVSVTPDVYRDLPKPEPKPVVVAPAKPDPAPVAVTPTKPEPAPERPTTTPEPPRTIVERPKPEEPVASVTGPRVPDPPVRPPTTVKPVDDDDDPAFYETWWFWTVVGVAVAGGGAATYFALSDTGAAPAGFRTTVNF